MGCPQVLENSSCPHPLELAPARVCGALGSCPRPIAAMDCDYSLGLPADSIDAVFPDRPGTPTKGEHGFRINSNGSICKSIGATPTG